MRISWYFISNSTHCLFVMKSNCGVFGQTDGADIETLRLLFYICFSSIQERSNKMKYFAENFLKKKTSFSHACHVNSTYP